MNVKENLDFLASLEFFGIKLGLEQTEELFRRLENPHKNLRFIHVAGSNGKGSVCAMLERSFRQAGLKTGFYSSPHLIRVGERFRINGIPASDDDVARWVEKLRPVIAEMTKEEKHVTYFEATTAIAACLFAEAGCDIVLWEVGMGGRLDSTNIVNPQISVITSISLEHADRLGGTLEKIAFEKAGIIKRKTPVFCAENLPDDAKRAIAQKAGEASAPLFYSQKTELIGYQDHIQKIRLEDGIEISTSLAGPHQRSNAALVYAVLRYLAPVLGIDLPVAAQGMALTQWNVRFQIWQKQKLIVDGAHNPEGLRALSGTLKELFPNQKFHFIFGAFADKDTEHGLIELIPGALSFTFIQMNTARRSTSAQELAQTINTVAGGNIPWKEMTLEDALNCRCGNEWRVLCGSLHLCGDALAILLKENEKQ